MSRILTIYLEGKFLLLIHMMQKIIVFVNKEKVRKKAFISYGKSSPCKIKSNLWSCSLTAILACPIICKAKHLKNAKKWQWEYVANTKHLYTCLYSWWGVTTSTLSSWLNFICRLYTKMHKSNEKKYLKVHLSIS